MLPFFLFHLWMRGEVEGGGGVGVRPGGGSQSHAPRKEAKTAWHPAQQHTSITPACIIWYTVIRFVSISAGPTAARLSSGSLADFLARKDLADFLLEAFARFSRRWGFACSVNNILSYLNITNLPICAVVGLNGTLKIRTFKCPKCVFQPSESVPFTWTQDDINIISTN